jgi:hypothetical protein
VSDEFNVPVFGSIIPSCIAQVTRWHGGADLTLIRSLWRSNFGSTRGQITQWRRSRRWQRARTPEVLGHDGPRGSSIPASLSMPGQIYLDLATSVGVPLKSDPMAGKCLHHPQSRFRRPAGMLPLSVPERGGSIAQHQRSREPCH